MKSVGKNCHRVFSGQSCAQLLVCHVPQLIFGLFNIIPPKYSSFGTFDQPNLTQPLGQPVDNSVLF